MACLWSRKYLQFLYACLLRAKQTGWLGRMQQREKLGHLRSLEMMRIRWTPVLSSYQQLTSPSHTYPTNNQPKVHDHSKGWGNRMLSQGKKSKQGEGFSR